MKKEAMRVIFAFLFGALTLILMGAQGGRTDCAVLTTETYIDINGSSAPAVSTAGNGRIYFDSTDKVPKISNTAGNYISLFQRKNLIINGDFNVAQRASTLAGFSATAYGMDRWNNVIAVVNSGVYTAAKFAADASPAGTQPSSVRSTYGLKMTCGTINTAVSAGSEFLIRQTIERTSIPHSVRYNGVTISFWVNAFQTGAFGLSLQDSSGNAAMTTFSISQSNTWQKVVQTFTGFVELDVLGDLELDICLIGGSNFQGTAGTAMGATLNGKYTTSSQVNFGSSTSNTFFLCDVQIEEGPQATTFESLPYQQELAMCQRYCYVPDCTGTASSLVDGRSSTTAQIAAVIRFPVRMRNAPALTATAADWQGGDGATAAFNSISINASTNNMDSCELLCGQAGATWTAGRCAVVFSNGASKVMIFNADF